MPKRIQRRRTKGWRMPANAVSVARPGIFGNPFVGAGAVDAFRRYLLNPDQFKADIGTGLGMAFIPSWDHVDKVLARLPELRGKDLACYCPLDKPCHADVLLELANR